jgi:hypothetical protein
MKILHRESIDYYCGTIVVYGESNKLSRKAETRK